MQILLVGECSDNKTFEEVISCSAFLSGLEMLSGPVHSSDALHPVNVAKHAEHHNVDLVIPTSSGVLERGLGNVLEIYRISCFGPTTVAAYLEREASDLIASLIVQSTNYKSELTFEANDVDLAKCDYFCGLIDHYAYKLLGSTSVLNPAAEILADHLMRSFLKYCLDVGIDYSGFLNIAYQVQGGILQVVKLVPSPRADVWRSLVLSKEQDVLQEILELRQFTAALRSPSFPRAEQASVMSIAH